MVEIPLDSLKERERNFIAHYCATGDGTASAAAAGYQGRSAQVMGWRLLRTPHILAAIHVETARQLLEGAPIALKTIQAIARDESAPVKVRLDAAKALLDRAGHVTPRAKSRDDGAGRTLHEMSREELLAHRAQLEDEIASRAKAINAPVGADESPDILA